MRTVFASAVRSLVRNHQLGRLATKTVVQRFEELQTVLGSELIERFFEKFSGRLQKFPEHFSGADSLTMPPAFLSAAAKTSAPGYETIGSFVENYFEGLSEEEWVELLNHREQKAMEHLFARIELHQYKPAKTSYLSALMKHTLGVLDENLEVTSFQDRWAVLFDGLQKNTKDKFARDLLVNLNQITTTTKSVERFLIVSLPFANELPFKEQPDGCLDHLVVPLISSQSELGMSFVREHAGDFAACVKGARADVRGRLEEALLSLRQGAEERETRANEIAALLNIALPKPEATALEPEVEGNPKG